MKKFSYCTQEGPKVDRLSKWCHMWTEERSTLAAPLGQATRNHLFLPKGCHAFVVLKIVTVQGGKAFSRETEVSESLGKLMAVLRFN